MLNNQGQDIFLNDGNLSLHLEPDSLPGNEALLAVLGPLSTGLVLVRDPYDVTASGALVELEEPGVRPTISLQLSVLGKETVKARESEVEDETA